MIGEEPWNPKKGYRPSREEMDYELNRRAVAKVVHADPNIQQIARSSTFRFARDIRNAGRIAADLMGLKDVPKGILRRAETVRLIGVDERVSNLDPRSRILMQAAGLVDFADGSAEETEYGPEYNQSVKPSDGEEGDQ